MPTFLFACDASPSLGMGHVRRCMTLARALRVCGVRIAIVCHATDVNLSNDLAELAHECRISDWSLSGERGVLDLIQFHADVGAHAIILDRSGIPDAALRRLAENDLRWLEFDSGERRPLRASWLLNPSPTAAPSMYRDRVCRSDSRLLLGPRYALVRDEFRRVVSTRPEVRTILLTFGGGDDRGATRLCLEALSDGVDDIEVVVLLAGANPGAPELRRLVASAAGVRLVSNAAPTDVAKEMTAADLAIIAGGGTTFEAAAMGLPMLIVQIAPNQAVYASAWQQAGAAVNLGPLEAVTASGIARATRELIRDPERRAAMSRAGTALVDGRGARRVADCMLADVDGSTR